MNNTCRKNLEIDIRFIETYTKSVILSKPSTIW